MARIPSGICGGVLGNVGNVIGSTWKGKPYIKIKPLIVNQPDSKPQTDHRSKFTNVSAVARILLANIIKPLWDRYVKNMSGYNRFIKYNINLFEDSSPSPDDKFVITVGQMQGTVIDSIDLINGSCNVDFNWTDDTGIGFKTDLDKCYVVCYNSQKDEWGSSPTPTLRNSEFIRLVMPTMVVAGNKLSCYMAFKSGDGARVSFTSYVTGVCGE